MDKNEIKQYDTAKQSEKPIVEGLILSDEIISTITNQVEILAERLSSVSATVPNESPKDSVLDSGGSPLSSHINSQYRSLLDISDAISYMTRALEV